MAVVSHNLYFSYSKYNKCKLILKDVNVIVNEAEIFGLLGPSGCGKTTFLKTIVGLCKPDFGSIYVFGHQPGSKESGVPGAAVGYMPQELALQNDLTIGEILLYFGRICCLKDRQINEEIKFWVKTLDLPESKRLIANLSEGQKRRLSFAITMIHKPKLLLVDEPTAGVDPILSKKMWDLLEDFAKNNGTSIIITTHYFSEAKRANVIAFMRKGQILEKGPPQLLLQRHNVETIDELFIFLSSKQDKLFNETNCEMGKSGTNINKNKANDIQQLKSCCSSTIEQKKIIAVIWKYIIQTRRNPFAMLVFFGTMIFTSYLSTLVIGSPPKNIPVAWVVAEALPKFQDEINGTNVNFLNDSQTDHDYSSLYLPEIFKNSIDSKLINLKNYNSLNRASIDMKKGLVEAILYFGPNFTDFYLKSDPIFGFSDEWVDNETLSNGSIHFTQNVVNRVISNTVKLSINDAVLKFRRNLANILETESSFVESIIELVGVENLEKDIFDLKNFVAPGFILFYTFLAPFFISTITLSVELNENTFNRSIVSGITLFQMTLAQILGKFLFAAISALINFFASVWFAQIPYNKETLIPVLLLLWLQTLAGIISGMLLAVILNNVILSIFFATFISMILFSTSDVFRSVLSQPYYIQWLSYYMPLVSPLRTFRTLMNPRNYLFSSSIWPGYVISIFWIAMPFILCIWFLKMRT